RSWLKVSQGQKPLTILAGKESHPWDHVVAAGTNIDKKLQMFSWKERHSLMYECAAANALKYVIQTYGRLINERYRRQKLAGGNVWMPYTVYIRDLRVGGKISDRHGRKIRNVKQYGFLTITFVESKNGLTVHHFCPHIGQPPGIDGTQLLGWPQGR
ncbi:MAG: hypothetical protein ACKOA8_08350, partial [Deltaproteobacteria bacterium]